MKRLLILTALLASFIFAGNVQADLFPINSLGYLIEDTSNSITADDKVFDQWRLLGDANLSMDGLTEIFPDLGYIQVSPINDGGLDPGPGLRFDVVNGALDASGGQFIHLLFGFRVTTIDDLLIKDNSLAFASAALINIAENLGISIKENIFDVAGNLLGEKYVEFSDGTSGNVSNLNDSVRFDPINQIFVTKEILIWATDPDEIASLTGFTQRFSQTEPVPEPATMFLLGTGLVGVAGAARRRKRQ